MSVLTEPSPWPFAFLLRVRCTTRRRGVGELCPRAPRPCARLCLSLQVHTPQPRLVAAPPSAEATPRRRRRGAGDSSRRRRQGAVPVGTGGCLPSRPSTGHQQRPKKARGDGVGRRPTTPLDALGERSPAPATAAAALWFQSQGQRQWHCCGARETAQELQHGCGDDCSRSASLAALHARPLALH